MKTFGVSSLAVDLQLLMSCRDSIHLSDISTGTKVDAGIATVIASVLGRIKTASEELGLDSSLVECIGSLVLKLNAGTADTRPAALGTQIEIIREGIEVNLSKRHFMVLTEEEASFYSNPELFGESFAEKYPARAMRESLDAGNCYAASLYTACVFHCMRVAEYGLRKLAANSMLRVKITDRGKVCPIEYGTWNKVITAIRNKISKIRSRPDSIKKESDLQFFSNAADHCEYMKDIWRNELSHTRRAYKKEEALAVINRVKEFVIAVGDHKGSAPAEDSIIFLFARARMEEDARVAALAAGPTILPLLRGPSPLSNG